MGQFDDTVDNAIGGTELSPSPQLDPIGQQAAPLPDVSPILSSMPGIPQPPPTPPPPVNLPLSPKQKLMALFATSFALGAGPHSGEAMGALQGLAAERQKEQQNAMLQWNVQRQQNDQQRKIVEQQQAELDRQRSLKLTQTFDNFRKDLQKVQETGTDEDYRKLVSMYSGALTASGFRVPPQYFYQNFKFTPPTEQQAIQKALTTYYADPLNKKLLETNPSQVEAGAITYKATINGQPVLKRLSIADARKALGVDNNVINGQPMFSTLGKGPEIQQDTARATAEIEAELGRPLDPKSKSDNNALMKRVGEFQAQRKPPESALDTALKQSLLAQRTQAGAAKEGAVDAVTSNAQQLLDGNLAPSMLSKRADTYNATLAKANKLSLERTGRPLNLNKLQLDYESAKRWVGSMNSSNLVRYRGLGESVVNTINEVRDLGDQLKQGGVQLWNRAKRSTIQQVYGNTPQSELAARYVSAVNTLKEEFANLAQGGGAPTEPAWNLANDQINGDYGVRDLEASLLEAQRLVNYRLNALSDQEPVKVKDQGQPPAVTPPPAPSGEQKIGRFTVVTKGS
jgi:hypothetical protein